MIPDGAGVRHENRAETCPCPSPAPARLEAGGLVIGIVAGVGIALGWLISTRGQPPRPVVYSTHPPVLVHGASGTAAEPDPAALNAEWADYSNHASCADWAGGDGVSAIRLNSSQLAWFFSDTYLGPAGPAIGFSHLSGFMHNSVVVQTTSGPGSTFVTLTGGGACTGPGAAGATRPPWWGRRRPDPACRPTGTGRRTASGPAARSSSSTTITWAAPSRTCRTER